MSAARWSVCSTHRLDVDDGKGRSTVQVMLEQTAQRVDQTGRPSG